MERQYKDSGIEWIGRIPMEWKCSEVRRIMRNKSIKNMPKAMVLSLYRDYGIVPKESRDDNHNVTSEDTSTYKYVEIGDFVINKMKAWQGSMAVSNYEGIISPAYYVCSFIENNLERKYIHYLLRNEAYKPEYLRLSTGLRVGQWDLGIDDFMKIPIVLPPLPEQQRIASYLDKKCVEIDELIALQEKMIAQLTEYKQAVITEAVTKGLDPNAKLVPSGIEWIGDVPEGWKVCKLKNSYTLLNGRAYLDPELLEEGKYRILRVGNLFSSDKWYYSDLELEPNKYCEAGDLLYGWSASIGPYIWKEEKVIYHYHIWKVLFGTNNLHFSYYLLKALTLAKQRDMHGSAMQHLTKNGMDNSMIPLPPLPEQHSIASYLDTKCSEIDTLITLKRQKIESLNAYKKSVIYEAVTGKTIIE